MPAGRAAGDKLETVGVAITVKTTPGLCIPLAVTTTLPVVVPAGTVATIEVALQLVTVVALVPLKVTVLVPCVEPKFVPASVIDVPTGAAVGDRLVRVGPTITGYLDDAKEGIADALRGSTKSVFYNLLMVG